MRTTDDPCNYLLLIYYFILYRSGALFTFISLLCLLRKANMQYTWLSCKLTLIHFLIRLPNGEIRTGDYEIEFQTI